jgi:hypothetical protein
MSQRSKIHRHWLTARLGLDVCNDFFITYLQHHAGGYGTPVIRQPMISCEIPSELGKVVR